MLCFVRRCLGFEYLFVRRLSSNQPACSTALARGVTGRFSMDAFAERARIELAATGEKVRKRTSATRGELTVQERQIAQLARGGFSNPEIGARLFLSPRTVEWHLHHVYTKLGVGSRRDLRHALGDS